MAQVGSASRPATFDLPVDPRLAAGGQKSSDNTEMGRRANKSVQVTVVRNGQARSSRCCAALLAAIAVPIALPIKLHVLHRWTGWLILRCLHSSC